MALRVSGIWSFVEPRGSARERGQRGIYLHQRRHINTCASHLALVLGFGFWTLVFGFRCFRGLRCWKLRRKTKIKDQSPKTNFNALPSWYGFVVVAREFALPRST